MWQGSGNKMDCACCKHVQHERGVQGTARERARGGNKGEGAEDNGCWGRADEESVRRGGMLGVRGEKVQTNVMGTSRPLAPKMNERIKVSARTRDGVFSSPQSD